MRIVLLWIFLFLFSPTIKAQQWPFELWHEGRIVLASGDTLKGFVKYDLQQDFLQYQYQVNEMKVEAFTPRKVLFFEIFDISVHKYRQFFALPFKTTSGYNAPIFFELLEEGKITLLAREAVEYKTYSSPYYIGGYSRQVLVNKYYIMDAKGNINPFNGNTRRDVLDLMDKKSDVVAEYIKTNRLDYTEKHDLTKIIQYYNSLFL